MIRLPRLAPPPPLIDPPAIWYTTKTQTVISTERFVNSFINYEKKRRNSSRNWDREDEVSEGVVKGYRTQIKRE